MIDVFMTTVAGINFRATTEDIGPVIGYVQKDENNEFDPRAVGVYKPKGELLGFIPSKDLDKFYEFKGDYDKLVFTGNIKLLKKYGKEYFVGSIAIIKSENEEELTEIANEYLMDENFSSYGKSNVIRVECGKKD